MQNAAHIYGKVAKQTSSPRDLEASLLLQAAARLQAVCDGWETSQSKLSDALLYNRKLWTIFMSSVTEEGHQLPREIRENVANLGIFVMNQTLTTICDPRPEHLNSLIRINRELATGLLGRG